MEPTPLSSIELEALAKLPVYLDDSEADGRYGSGLREGSDYRQAVLALLNQAEDSLGEIESTFEVPLRQTEDDFETLDRLIANGWSDRWPSEAELAAIALGWGAYVAELILKSLGGAWVIRPDPQQSSLRFPRLGVQFFPVHALLRRFALRDRARLEDAYSDLVEALIA